MVVVLCLRCDSGKNLPDAPGASAPQTHRYQLDTLCSSLFYSVRLLALLP